MTEISKLERKAKKAIDKANAAGRRAGRCRDHKRGIRLAIDYIKLLSERNTTLRAAFTEAFALDGKRGVLGVKFDTTDEGALRINLVLRKRARTPRIPRTFAGLSVVTSRRDPQESLTEAGNADDHTERT